jgi:hypothetical protein
MLQSMLQLLKDTFGYVLSSLVHNLPSLVLGILTAAAAATVTVCIQSSFLAHAFVVHPFSTHTRILTFTLVFVLTPIFIVDISIQTRLASSILIGLLFISPTGVCSSK